MTSFELPTFPLKVHALGSEALKGPIVDVSTSVPSLTPQQLLVKVSYASLNPLDPKIHHFNFFGLPLPLVLGFDFSGVVVAVGGSEPAPHGGQSIEVGAEVMGFTGRAGCFADYVVVTRDVVVLRGAVPPAEASTYGVAYCTAYENLEVIGEVSKRAGQWIYVAGGSGGVGHFAVQLARQAGMKVIASASKPEALQLLRSLGVEHVIDYSKQDVVAEVLSVTGGRGVDVSYDPTYIPSSYRQSSAVVASGGVWVKLGAQSDAEAEFFAAAQQRGAQALIGDWGRYVAQPAFRQDTWKVRKGLEAAVGWYSEGKVKPHVNSTLPFEAKALQKALEDITEGRNNVGKVVMKVE